MNTFKNVKLYRLTLQIVIAQMNFLVYYIKINKISKHMAEWLAYIF